MESAHKSLMGNVHRLVLQHGIEEVRGMVASNADRRAIDAAAAILAEEELRLGISAYNFGRRLNTLKGLTPYEFIRTHP
jgi:hypothetical protein